jgi:hypothetical protein
LKNEQVRSTKKLHGCKAGAKFGTTVSSIGAIHNHSRFQLTPTDIGAPAEKSHVRLPNLGERELDGLALSAQKTIGYYGIISGTTLYMHLEMYIEIIGLEMQAPIETNNFVICKLKHTTVCPRFHVKAFPSDTCGQIKIKIHEYLKGCVLDAHKNSTDTEREKDTKLQLDLDRIKTEKWVLIQDGCNMTIVESRPLQYYLIQGFTMFWMTKSATEMNVNTKIAELCDSAAVHEEYVRRTAYKEHTWASKEIPRKNDNQFIVHVNLVTGKNIRDVKVRPSMKVSSLKKILAEKFKGQGIEVTPGDFYLTCHNDMLPESKNFKELGLKIFAEIFVMRVDGQML